MMVLLVSPLLNLNLSHRIPTILSVNTQVSAYHVETLCKQGRLKEALHILNRAEIENGGVGLDSSTYFSLLQACIQKKALAEGKLIHAHINQSLRDSNADRLVGNTLVNMYVKCGNKADARRVFDQMPERDVFSWTVMIAAYAKYGPPQEALYLFHQMMATGVQPNHFTFTSVLPACATLPSLQQGMEIHHRIIKSGYESHVVVGNALMDMYTKCGRMKIARALFDQMPERDVISWTVMLAGYAQNGFIDEALNLFKEMPAKDVISWNAMITGFVQNGLINEARKLFEEMPQRDMASWNAMIAGFAQAGRVDEALRLFREMPQRNAFSWNTMIAGYAQNGLVEKALGLFENMPRRDVFSWTAMIAGFAQNGFVDRALKLFEEMPQPNVVSWNAMIAGFAQNGRAEEAMKLYKQMQAVGVKPDSKTFPSVLTACANLAALEQGMEMHEKIIRCGFEYDTVVTNALIYMYAKCGNIQKARELFDNMHQQSIVSWSAMIAGYAMHGCGKEALKLFEQMKLSGMSPNRITFVSVLSACSHAGLMDEGYQYFNSMQEIYHITPTMEHYRCMVDLLGRAGCLVKAQDFINKMPIKPDPAIWICLLGACRIHKDIGLGEKVAERVFELDPQNSAPYMLLSNIYAATGRWDGIKNIRKMMKEGGVTKTPGCSWIEVNKQMHVFLVGDTSHPQTYEIYTKLESLCWEMKLAGYIPEKSYVLNDVKDEEKEQILNHHSEKLAITFGLLNTPLGTTIRVIKNLRVCGDCHTTTKFISKIVAREIIVRDTSRFHHFKDGQCSCGDYW